MATRFRCLPGRAALLLAMTALLASCAAQRTAAPTHRFTGLKTRIETPRLEETAAFYTGLLGLTVLDAWDEDGDRGMILGLGPARAAEAFLELAQGAAAPAPAVSLQFRVDDLAAVEARLRGQWEYRGPEARPWGSTYLYLRDPAGVQVIVYQGEL